MSLFKKLKNRLLKTSSKLDEGLDAIVKDTREEATSVSEPDVDILPDVETPQARADRDHPNAARTDTACTDRDRGRARRGTRACWRAATD
jgi:hypothetical protein